MSTNKKILDPCCSSRMWHFDKNNKDVLYADNRELEDILCDGRTLQIKPDEFVDFRDLPYKDESFYLVLFDPPHLRHAGKNSWLAKKYGTLGENWKDDIKKGLSECWRVLKPNGTLIFKWNEEQVSFSDVKPLLPSMPVVGHRRGKTIFVVLFKGEESE